MPYNNIYKVDYGTLNKWLIPPILRRTKLIAWLGLLIAPIVFIYQDFLRYRKAKLYQLMITPQVCYLERMLNDSFDFTLRRIRIDDAVWHMPVYIYQEAELKPLWVFKETENMPQYVRTESEAGEFQDDFVVLVPNGLAYNENEMKAKIMIYKLAGTKFKIQII